MFRELEAATGISFYIEDELTVGVQPKLLPLLQMQCVPRVVFGTQAIADAVGFLRTSNSLLGGSQVLGVDAEWEAGADGGRQKVATIQVAPLQGTTFLFHLQRGRVGFSRETFPSSLRGLLEDPSIVKVSTAM